MDWQSWLNRQIEKDGGKFTGRVTVSAKVGYTERYLQDLATGRAPFGRKAKWRFADAYPELRILLLAEMGYLSEIREPLR